MATMHRFKTETKMGRKGRRGQTKAYRIGSRNRGGGMGKKGSQGSGRHPF